MEIQEGLPLLNGNYVAYIDDDFTPHIAKRIFLLWYDNYWSYPTSDQKFRGHIYGWIGPIPNLKLTDS